MSTKTQAKPLFAATLTPNRSLGRRGLRIVMILLAALATVAAALFSSIGAWPVVLFLAADVLLLGWALRLALRDGTKYEEVTLWPDQLRLRRVSARGREEVRRFTPATVKLVIDRDMDERTIGLHLRTADADTEIGAFLNPDDKTSFAKVFGTALKRARG